MRLSWDVDGSNWNLLLTLDPEDPVTGKGQGQRDISLLSTRATVTLPEVVARPHPDLEALAALVIAKPWTAQRLRVERAVSQAFADAVHRVMQVEILSVDDSLVPRSPGTSPLLAYSAGFDSAAASLLLPEGTPHIHHRRVSHPRVPNRTTHWRADAIERLVRIAAERGRNVKMVRTDFEYLVHPFPSLPHWLGFAVGPLLMADHLDAGVLALGGTLETFYMDMGRKWLKRNLKPLGLDPVVSAVGLPLMRPVLGVTEIGTMRMALESDLGDISRSCSYGTYTQPCGRCGKCIRKDLITATVLGEIPPSLRALTEQDLRAAGMLADGPLYMQAQLEYALARIDPPDGPLRALRERLEPVVESTAWMERVNPQGLEHGVPESRRDQIAVALEQRLAWMTDEDLSAARSFVRE